MNDLHNPEQAPVRPPQATAQSHLLYRLTGVLLFAWSGVVAASLAWSVYHEQAEARVIGRREANGRVEADRALLLWATSQGGVYVPVTAKTAPNPYLAHLPEREVTTPSGRRLTLMNPAQMAREFNAYTAGDERVQSRLTSLRPLRPENGPDDWERAALARLRAGAAEVDEVTRGAAGARFRLMRPLVSEAACRPCHAGPGWHEGDLLGGISVSLPMAPLEAISRRHDAALAVGHAGLWLAGVVGIGAGRRKIAREIGQRWAMETDLHLRTADLRHLFDHAPVSLWREDFSAVKRRIDTLRAAGVTDFRSYLTGHPEVVHECAALVRVVDVNDAALALHRATSRKELLTGLVRTFTDSSYAAFREELIAASMGETEIATEAEVRTLDGEERHVRVTAFIDPESPEWTRTYVAIVDLTEHNQMEETIRAALRDKEALVREVHHRVKNNFQVIVSLLRLQSRHLDDPRLKAAFQESVNRIHTMAMVHERLYGDANLTTLEGGEYLRAIVADLKRLFGPTRVTVSVEADPTPLAVDTAIPCGLIVNELVSNAFKHAFPDGGGGTIRVALRRQEGDDGIRRVRLTVSDDGAGIDPALSLDPVEGVGLRLVATLAENQLGGTMEVHPHNPTSFTIGFTLPSGAPPHGST